MIKKILYNAIIILIGMIKSAIIGGIIINIASIVITGGEDIPEQIKDVVFLVFIIMEWLLPALFLYHLFNVLRLRTYICDIIYIAGFILSGLLFCFWYIFFILRHAVDEEIFLGFLLWLYMFVFTGLSMYIAEIIFRTQKRIEELKLSEALLDLENKFERTSQKIKNIFFGIRRSLFIASIITIVAATGPAYTYQLHFKPVFLTKALIYLLLYLFPAIVLYHIVYILKRKRWICDTVYFAFVVIIELCFLPSSLNRPPHHSWYDYGYMPAYAMSLIALNCIFVYMSEVYFRNRAILKNLKQIKNPDF